MERPGLFWLLGFIFLGVLCYPIFIIYYRYKNKMKPLDKKLWANIIHSTDEFDNRLQHQEPPLR